jgi:beta-1,4-mannosyltransferase
VTGPRSELDYRYSQGVLTNFDVDVVHVLDSNLDLLLGTRGATKYQRLLAASVFARNLRRHDIALVRTLQATDKQRGGSFVERLTDKILDRATDAFVTLDDLTPTPDTSLTTVVPHAHFRERFVGYPSADLVRGRILCIGASHLPVKSQGLLAATRVLDESGVTIRLAGLPPRGGGDFIRTASAKRPGNVSTRIERLSESARVQEIDAAELIAIPQHIKSLDDLQLVFLALSRDRCVLTPSTEAMVALSRSVGPGWIHLSEESITAESIDNAFRSMRADDRSDRPDLSQRDMETTHASYEAVFRRVARRSA